MAAGKGQSEVAALSAGVAPTRRRAHATGARAALALMVGVVVLWAVVLAVILRAAALGPDDAGKVFVVFAPGTAPAEAFAAIVGAGGEPVRAVLGDWAWIAHAEGRGFVGGLERNGALAAFRGAPVGLSLAGCFAWATDRPVPQDPFARALAARAAADGS
ncbi:MAG: hypothetical protein ACREIR_20885 [Geminicoccaceae bacterium]